MRRVLIGMVVMSALYCVNRNETYATLVAFDFEGLVTTSSGAPFGAPIALNDPVAGKFTYDTASLPTLDVTPGICTDCAYRQQFVNGFRATIGGAEFLADDYAVEYFNDVNGVTDVFNVGFVSNYAPALAPYVANGTPQAVGQFRITLLGLSNALSGPSLPENLNLANFILFKQGFVASAFPGQSEIEFSITSLTPAQVDVSPRRPAASAPEPSTVLLLSFAALFFLYFKLNPRWSVNHRRY